MMKTIMIDHDHDDDADDDEDLPPRILGCRTPDPYGFADSRVLWPEFQSCLCFVVSMSCARPQFAGWRQATLNPKP